MGIVLIWNFLPTSALKAHQPASLAGQFPIKGRQGDGKGLQGAHGESVIHGEDVLCHTAELHHDVILCKRCQQEGGQEKKRSGIF